MDRLKDILSKACLLDELYSNRIRSNLKLDFLRDHTI